MDATEGFATSLACCGEGVELEEERDELEAGGRSEVRSALGPAS